MALMNSGRGDGSGTAPPRASRLVWPWVNLALFVACAAVIAVSLGSIAERPAWRVRVDATKTRAYSLSEQTRQMLQSLQGRWTLTLVVTERELDRSTLRQIDEVLARYDEASPNLTVERIDPTSAESTHRYLALLERLRVVYAGDVDRYETALAVARAGYESCGVFAREEAIRLAGLVAELGPGDPLRAPLEQFRNGFILLSETTVSVQQVMEDALRSDDAQPIPDYEKARDTLAAALRNAAQDLDGVSRHIENNMLRSPSIGSMVRGRLAAAKVRYDEQAARAQQAADGIIHLPPLELARIGRELAKGEAAVIVSDSRATVVPAGQFISRSNIRQTREGGVTFDQRFRGEQVLSSAIRSMLVDRMPMVVFVHVEDQSMIQPRRDRADAFGAASLLRSARFDVREWNVTKGERPRPESQRPVVWVVLQRPFGERVSRGNPAPTRQELALIDTARQLLESGESVLLGVFPSVLHKLRQPDPWQTMLRAQGIEADTARVVMEHVVDPGGATVVLRTQELIDLPNDHPISRAAQGQRLALPLAVPLGRHDAAPASLRLTALALAQPAASRWADVNWIDAITNPAFRPAPESYFTEPLPLAYAATRPDPMGSQREQRFVIVGSGAWLQADIADQPVSLGGERMALLYPGNFELLQAATAWLAGLDDLIAQSPTARQVARLDGVTDTVRLRWRWIALVVMPGACFGLGVLVWVIRRR